MTRPSQTVLRDAAASLCRAAVWLDPQRSDGERATEQAVELMRAARLAIESVEMAIAHEQKLTRDALTLEGSR